MSWYYVDAAGTTQGPLSEDVMKSKYASKQLKEENYVWNGADVNQWTPLSGVPQLLSKVKPSGGGPKKWGGTGSNGSSKSSSKSSVANLAKLWSGGANNSSPPNPPPVNGRPFKQKPKKENNIYTQSIDDIGSWYYVDAAGATQGPLSVKVMKSKYASKLLKEESYVWNGADVNQWTPLSGVPQLLRKVNPSVGCGGGAVPQKKHIWRRQSRGINGGRANLLASIRGGPALKKVANSDKHYTSANKWSGGPKQSHNNASASNRTPPKHTKSKTWGNWGSKKSGYKNHSKNANQFNISNFTKLSNATIALLFMQSMDAQITNIESCDIDRNQLAMFEFVLKGMRDNYGKRGFVLERWLFHGTDETTIQKIIKNGFNRDYNHRAAYGKGVYFGRNPRIADGYSTMNARGEKRILLCRVAIGEYTHGNSSMMTPPMKPDGSCTFDCLVDNPAYPSFFVISKDYHAIPMYCITYKSI